jgi:hypothetical protein
MTAATLETLSRVQSYSDSPQTRPDYDWLLPTEALQEELNGDTATKPFNGSATTRPTDGRRVAEPIRKDKFGPRLPAERVRLLQQWECVVLSVHDDCVECEMHDLTDVTKPVEWAEVYLEEFNHFDRALLREGAVFYWSIGHETKATGQVRRYSELRVRRMPPLSKLTKREISERASRLSVLIASNS